LALELLYPHFLESNQARKRISILSEKTQLRALYEGMARTYAIAKDFQHARDCIRKALEQLDRAAGMDPDDKKTYADQIRETEELTEQ
jgi:hypothetical protein